MPSCCSSSSESQDLAFTSISRIESSRAREMGPADAARFINQVTAGSGDYTEERKELFKDLTVEDIVRQIDERTRGRM